MTQLWWHVVADANAEVMQPAKVCRCTARSAFSAHRIMVSFSCEVCNDTVLKKKLDAHKQRCPGAVFTCIDCSVTFQGTDYRTHTSCISEAQKYEKGLYRGKKVPVKQENALDTKESKESKDVKPEKIVSKSDQSEKLKVKKEKKAKKETKDKERGLSKRLNLFKYLKGMSEEEKKALLKRINVTQGTDGELQVSLKN